MERPEGESSDRRECPFYLTPLSLGGTAFVLWMNALHFASTHEGVRRAIEDVFSQNPASSVVEKPSPESNAEKSTSSVVTEALPSQDIVRQKPAIVKMDTDQELILEQSCRANGLKCD